MRTHALEHFGLRSAICNCISGAHADRLLFSTDYPHWDFDDPRSAFRVRLPPAEHQAIMRDNAIALYGLG
jgi:predicted TIM-barrel fold metal-dependent hydrolase